MTAMIGSNAEPGAALTQDGEACQQARRAEQEPAQQHRHLTPAGQDQARPEAREPEGHVRVHVAGGLR